MYTEKKNETFLSNRYVQGFAQLALGGIFVYAALPKLVNPENFAETIRNYRILPEFLVPFLSFALPVFELVFGILLVLKIKPKLSAAVLTALLGVFIIALSAAVIQGIDITCGCFFETTQDPVIGRSEGLYLILRDILFLIPGIIIILFNKDEK